MGRIRRASTGVSLLIGGAFGAGLVAHYLGVSEFLGVSIVAWLAFLAGVLVCSAFTVRGSSRV